MEAIASRLEGITTSSKKLLGWRPLPVGWRQILLLARSYLMEAIALEAITTSSKKLLGWRPSLVGWRPSLLLVARSY